MTERYSADLDPVFANVSLLVGLSASEGVVELEQLVLGQQINSETRTRTVRTLVQNVYDYNRQTIADILLHQVSRALFFLEYCVTLPRMNWRDSPKTG